MVPPDTVPPDIVPPEVVLASASPRRRELLDRLGLAHRVVPADLDETPHDDEDALVYVERLALAKALAVADRLPTPGAVVIGADTTVELDGRILGKPEDHDDARRMLRALSARTHRVHTGVAVVRGERRALGVSTTLVRFTPLSAETIEWYLGTGEPFDKAGAYALQGSGGVFVDQVTGSVSGVIGLPLGLVADLCRQVGLGIVPATTD